MKKKLLIVDDEPSIRSLLRRIFLKKEYEVYEAGEGGEALAMVSGELKGSHLVPDAILLDVHLPDRSGLEMLEELGRLVPDVSVLIITGYGDVEQSVEAMRKGAADYILKPFNTNEIVLRVERTLERRQLKGQVDYFSQKQKEQVDSDYVVGPNPVMKKLYGDVETIAKSSATTVFIRGESGTGKEHVAKRIHRLSDRADGPFVDINASALSSELLESELFGHEEGAFTGATSSKKGLFEVASGGTLFLDEIGDMAYGLQSKLLRVLQEREIRRVGGTQPIPVDVRLITATHKDLHTLVEEGTFRGDLYYRLNVVPLDLPPLRERREDIEGLVHHFIEHFRRELRHSVEEVEPEALALLRSYDWPGNIRELRNLLERTLLLECDGRTLCARHLRSLGAESSSTGGNRATALIGQPVPLSDVERAHIEGVLSSVDGNKNQAAQILGIDRSTLYSKIRKYQL